MQGDESDTDTDYRLPLTRGTKRLEALSLDEREWCLNLMQRLGVHTAIREIGCGDRTFFRLASGALCNRGSCSQVREARRRLGE